VGSLAYGLSLQETSEDQEGRGLRLVRAREAVSTFTWSLPRFFYVKSQAFVVRSRNAKLVVVDPYRTGTAQAADQRQKDDDHRRHPANVHGFGLPAATRSTLPSAFAAAVCMGIPRESASTSISIALSSPSRYRMHAVPTK